MFSPSFRFLEEVFFPKHSQLFASPCLSLYQVEKFSKYRKILEPCASPSPTGSCHSTLVLHAEDCTGATPHGEACFDPGLPLTEWVSLIQQHDNKNLILPTFSNVSLINNTGDTYALHLSYTLFLTWFYTQAGLENPRKIVFLFKQNVFQDSKI
jgi:hypothetical protein